MIQNLDYNQCTQFGIDYTYRIIQKIFKPYKLVPIYAINKKESKSIIACLILFKYDDANSLMKIFSISKKLGLKVYRYKYYYINII